MDNKKQSFHLYFAELTVVVSVLFGDTEHIFNQPIKLTTLHTMSCRDAGRQRTLLTRLICSVPSSIQDQCWGKKAVCAGWSAPSQRNHMMR